MYVQSAHVKSCKYNKNYNNNCKEKCQMLIAIMVKMGKTFLKVY